MLADIEITELYYRLGRLSAFAEWAKEEYPASVCQQDVEFISDVIKYVIIEKESN